MAGRYIVKVQLIDARGTSVERGTILREGSYSYLTPAEGTRGFDVACDAAAEIEPDDCCDECGTAVPDTATAIEGKWHAPACSAYDANVD